jgi:hypothetical protein
VSLAGTGIATAMAMLFAVLLILDFAGYLTNPYLGLLSFVAVPVGFILGLLLIPIGLWIDARRRRRAPDVRAASWPVVDLRLARTRTTVMLVLVLTAVNLVIVSLAAYGGVHYMETAGFCGTVCHTTMEPQFVAHQNGPHARVACVDCHVGSGVDALVESKLAGTRQLWLVMTDSVPQPIPPPLGLMRTAPETCEQCHWPEKFHGDKLRVINEYANDEANSEIRTTLELHVGGGSNRLGVGTGIHWHMNLDNVVEYVAADGDRQEIPYVRFTERGGRVREFVAEGATAAQFADAARHRMDCMDCHNRPAHTFAPTPERAISQAMAEGRIPRTLPFVHQQAVAAVAADHEDRDTAMTSIARSLGEFYREGTHDSKVVGQAIAGTQDVWSRNVFPAMNVHWGTYPNNIGHLDSPGCFRCHDDSHTAVDGSVISQDCELCHAMP